MDETKEMARMAIDIHGELIEVFPEDNKQRFDKGYGYIHGDRVYIFRGKLKKNKPTIPGSVYYSDGKKPVWVDPTEDEDEFSVANIFPLSMEGIIAEVQNKENLKSINPVLLDKSGECFAPRIIEQDDALKVLIKKALAELQVNVKPSDKDKATAEMVNNLKSNLINPDTRMSILYFAKWCWLLGLRAKMEIKLINQEGEEVTLSENLRYNYNIR